MLQKKDGGVEFVFYFRSNLPKGTKKYVTAYAREYAESCGWKIRRTNSTPHYMAFVASKA